MAGVLKKYELEAKLKDEHKLIEQGILRDENPLDLTSDFTKFLGACRKGDLKTCQELISNGVNINGKDAFDYTPLIIASLCGHFELVQLLLESGALAERNTFQGERAVYNALNDRIRNLLLSYDYSKSTDPLQPWSSHITSLLTRQIPKTADITLTSGSESLHLHKFLLSARTPYFRAKLADAPETTQWKLSSAVPVEAFQLVAQYLYLGELPRELVDPRSSTSEEEVFKGIDKISKQLEVENFWETALTLDDRRLARQRYQDEIHRAQEQVESFFQEHVVRHKMVVDTKKVNEIKWKVDNSIFADCLLRADEEDGGDEDEGDDEQETATIGANGIPIGPASETSNPKDTNRKSRKSTVFPVHKAMLIRSPYFETMFSSEFLEAQESEHLHIIKVDCTPEVLEIILTFMYTEKSDCPLELALELLYTSDMLLMDRLKSKAAQAISTLGSATGNILVDRTHSEGHKEQVEVEPINVYDVIHAAWDLRVQRLEEFAARYLAYRLEDYIDEPEFAELIQESASRLKLRQETDTIELLDDIRYYLSERFRLRFEDAGLDEMLDEEGEIRPEAVEGLVAANGERLEATKETGTNGAAPEVAAAIVEDASPGNEGGGGGGAGGVRTLEGEVVDDEFDLDAMNYQILLRKIDNMLEGLKLDA
ncbi:btb poz domain-containing protein [Diaporthe amygdali]|uniref:btb poz domain-containing protein n=1 Tax=Phomopsis amygdali TaxID=1214568 RepID=UPI0022FE1DD3|nr:btb poz domain-containing protein [Diaporthe amygdali]KAJ0123566.1 btb poz domain-containing protein [Diaporthe amygdali]